MTYDGWIKVLSSTLILSGSVHDEILIRTGAVCKLDVSKISIREYFKQFFGDLRRINVVVAINDWTVEI